MHSSDLLAASLPLAVARYLQDHPDAVARAGAWLDADAEAWMA